MKIVPIILAGGSGKRLWPLSRKLYPKQFYSLLKEKSLLQETVLRLPRLKNLTSPIVICNKDHRFFVNEQLEEINVNDPLIVVESSGRNTAPAISAASLLVKRKYKDEETILLVFPSDHVIEDVTEFRNCIGIAVKQALKDKLVTFGIVPVKAHSGYGYIKVKSDRSQKGIFEMDRFIEKPSIEMAKSYIDEGGYLWNSGMFVFKTDVFLKELSTFSSQILTKVEKSIIGSESSSDYVLLEDKSFSSCPNISIDTAVMEKTKKAVVIPLEAGWSDVGSWSELYELNKKDKKGNVLQGDVIIKDSSNTFISANNHLIAVLGVKDLIVIDTPDATLITTQNKTQNIIDIIQEIEKLKRPEGEIHRKVYRPWGWFDSIDTGDNFQVKRINVKPGSSLSLQSHKQRDEHWIVVKGAGKVTSGDKVFVLEENQSTFIPKGTKHRLENEQSDPLEIIEVQYGDYLGEDDIVRFDDIYGR